MTIPKKSARNGLVPLPGKMWDPARCGVAKGTVWVWVPGTGSTPVEKPQAIIPSTMMLAVTDVTKSRLLIIENHLFRNFLICVLSLLICGNQSSRYQRPERGVGICAKSANVITGLVNSGFYLGENGIFPSSTSIGT